MPGTDIVDQSRKDLELLPPQVLLVPTRVLDAGTEGAGKLLRLGDRQLRTGGYWNNGLLLKAGL
ncbi:uncharacterized protein QC761_0001650 [Podospora bellae-mahoneyi]|uniref:Uncharacterized protein n=1 Tax=Podospora bellae-mahoneyi TaxID=2093777 RepID=A0ABR0FWL6_9PEZI|nr:hypothetical protein QC761_0001650 [Podospora bellae-mahoneyi]